MLADRVFLPARPRPRIARLRQGTAITAIGPYSVTLRAGPGLVAQLYAAGAHLVLPAGLTGCLPQIAL